VSAICVAPSGGQFVTTSWDQSVRIWDCGRVSAPRPVGHDEQVTAIAFLPDESRIVSGSQDRTLIVWDARDGRPLSRLRGHTHWISSVWAGVVIVSASWDGRMRVWDPVSGECRRVIPTGDEHVCGMTCDANGIRAATVSTEGIVRVWDLADGTQLAVTRSPEAEVSSIAFLDRGFRLRWASQRRRVLEWSMDDRAAVMIEIAGSIPATAWDLDERAGLSVLGSADGSILLFDRKGTTGARFGIRGCGPSAIARSADGETLLAAGGLPQMASDNTARLWRTSAPQRPAAWFLADTPLTAAALSRDGRLAVLGDASGAVHLLEWLDS
jgi:WD40 repeat protein